jgi:cation diffusion facilitator family transporter
MEGVAAFLEGLFILGSALWILREALIRFADPGKVSESGLPWAIAAMAFSLAVTTALVLYLKRLAKESSNLVLEADAAHYRMDIAVTLGVLLSLAAIQVTGWKWLDPAVAIVLSLVVARAAVPLIRKGLHMLLDRSLDPALVDSIRSIAMGHSDKVTGMHELKTRRSGDTLFVEFHLVFDESIKLRDAHRVADEIEARIRTLEPIRWIINVHLDPVDDSHRDRKLAKADGED